MEASRDATDWENVLQAAAQFAKEELGDDRSGHDWWHTHRVVTMARKLSRLEGADQRLSAAAAWLHDVADEKLNPSKEAGLQKVKNWLEEQPISEVDSRHIMEIISTMSYNAGSNPPMRTLEGKVVQDADRLDAIGAIAIARTFVYAGWKGDPIYDPDIEPRISMTSEEYRNGKSPAVNHFYEKLLKLKDLMNTATARSIAEERHRYMEEFLARFHIEWSGE
ncbi:phosphohydrolase [Paenibacillus sambharensis]|uniref:Phosphohydrolase n=1 Tax=Paenibacillus sambharensis TaxID=1803190 RepID=A0A2W1L2E1_9BACL|nr:HD domain-containing protein [Paenibacillus sambharensis]PZD93233.1 phosphohydrolase [Paenibacillus sambharensis]